MTATPRRIRIFLDANVIFAALWNRDGLPRRLLDRSDVFEMFTCDFAVEEARRNLAAKKPEALTELDSILPTIKVTPTVTGGTEIPLNGKDRPIYYSAKYCGAEVLLTGDKGFAEVAVHASKGGLQVLSPREFYERSVKST